MATILRSVDVQTRRRFEFLNITAVVQAEVDATGVTEGVALLRSRHTTGAITCQENDAAVHQDAIDVIRGLLPDSKHYRHSYEGSPNAIAHLSAMLLFGESTWVPIRAGKIDLGTWQSVFFVELSEARRRTVDIAVIGE